MRLIRNLTVLPEGLIDMDSELQAKLLLKKLNLVLSDFTEYDDDRFAIIKSTLDMFFQLPAIKSYYDHRAAIDEMVRTQPELDELLKGNYSRKKTFKEIRTNAK